MRTGSSDAFLTSLSKELTHHPNETYRCLLLARVKGAG